jgi:Zn-finger nucleic acid-binding protein
MRCPSCKTSTLKPKKLEYALPAMACSKCGGCKIDLLSYRLWRETKKSANKALQKPVKDVIDTKHAMLCPKCNSIMMKYRMDENIDNKIDLCGQCGEVWLDGGEWRLLETLNLSTLLPEILSSPWQKAIKKKEIANGIEQNYISELGNADVEKVKEIRSWLAEHSKSDLIKTLLFRDDEF